MSDKRIKHTRNYKLFQRSAENRPCEPGKRKKLERSLREYGWIPEIPMVCKMGHNGKLIIKDGQHRLAIAESLGIEVHYAVGDIDFDIAIVNSAQKPWVLMDYAQRFAAAGKQDYIEALEFKQTNGLPVGVAFGMLAGTTSFNNVSSAFMSGDFKIKDRAWAERVAGVYVPCVEASGEVKNARFLEACMAVCRVADFDPRRFIDNAKRRRDKLVSYSTREAYLEMMEDIYNFNKKQLVPLKIQAINAMKSRDVAVAASLRKPGRQKGRAA